MSRFNRRDFLSMAAGGAAAALFGGCENRLEAITAKNQLADISSKPMNILLIVVEDMGPQLGCYGDKTVPTPNLDKLASDGVLFKNAFTTHASCSPARSSIFTGLYPHQNGQVGLADCGYSMHRDIPTLTGLLGKAGYRTGLLFKKHVEPAEDVPADFFNPVDWSKWPNIEYSPRNVRDVAKLTENFIRESGDKKFFLMANFSDVHRGFKTKFKGFPENPIEDAEVLPFLSGELNLPQIREDVTGYYNCIQRIDAGVQLLREVLERTGHTDDTLVIFLADHGPAFTRGKLSCYEPGLHIPFMVHWPGRSKSGLVCDDLISVVDIFPTCLEAAGITVPDYISGRSLAGLVAGREVTWRQYIYGEYTSHSPTCFFPRRSIRDKRYKLIVNLLAGRENPVGGPDGCRDWEIVNSDKMKDSFIRKVYDRYHRPPAVELYDLQKDPNEFYNLAGKAEYKKIEAKLAGQLKLWRERTGDPLLDAKTLQILTEMHDKASERIEKEAEGIDWPERWKYYKIDMSRFQKDWR